MWFIPPWPLPLMVHFTHWRHSNFPHHALYTHAHMHVCIHIQRHIQSPVFWYWRISITIRLQSIFIFKEYWSTHQPLYLSCVYLFIWFIQTNVFFPSTFIFACWSSTYLQCHFPRFHELKVTFHFFGLNVPNLVHFWGALNLSFHVAVIFELASCILYCEQ